MGIGEQDLLLPYAGHIVFTTVAGQGWLAGPKPSLDAIRRLAVAGLKGQCFCAPILCFFEPLVARHRARGVPPIIRREQTAFRRVPRTADGRSSA